MERLGRGFAAAMLLFAITAVTLADGQMDVPITTPKSSATYQGQTDTPPAASSTAVPSQTNTTDTTATEAGLLLFQTFSSVL